MSRSRLLPLTFAAFLCLPAVPSRAANVKGVELADSVVFEGAALKLQGTGVRKKLGFSVYVGALYLKTATADAATAVRSDEPKQIVLHFLRDVGGSSLKEAFEEGFFNNAQERLDSLRSRIDALEGYLADGARKGQRVAFTYLPGLGTRVSVDGKDRGTIPGRDFMAALWAVWLGEVPASSDLKRGMMGLLKP